MIDRLDDDLWGLAMKSAADEIVQSCISKMASGADAEIRSLLEKRVGLVIDPEALRGRLTSTRVRGQTFCTMAIDGKPFVRVHDPEFSFTDGFVSATQKFEALS
jgi:hypothetical protein